MKTKKTTIRDVIKCPYCGKWISIICTRNKPATNLLLCPFCDRNLHVCLANRYK